MSSRNRLARAFYAILAVAGAAFVVTACAYGLMMLAAVHRPDPLQGTTPLPRGGLLDFMQRHGEELLAWELSVMAVSAAAAVCADGGLRRASSRAKVDAISAAQPAPDRREFQEAAADERVTQG
jgi:hypothetical protein